MSDNAVLTDKPDVQLWESEVLTPGLPIYKDAKRKTHPEKLIDVEMCFSYDPQTKIKLGPSTVYFWERLWICSPRGAAYRKSASIKNAEIDFDMEKGEGTLTVNNV